MLAVVCGQPLVQGVLGDGAGTALRHAHASGKRMGVVVEGGPLFEAYRQALRRAGLPVFLSMERALASLRLIAEN